MSWSICRFARLCWETKSSGRSAALFLMELQRFFLGANSMECTVIYIYIYKGARSVVVLVVVLRVSGFGAFVLEFGVLGFPGFRV